MSSKWIVTLHAWMDSLIEVYDTYDEAKSRYDERLNKMGRYEALYIAESREYTAGDRYDPNE